MEAKFPFSVVIIESPSANLNSIYIALKRIQQQIRSEGSEPFTLQISCDSQEILQAQRVIFPGVGHASYIMSALRYSGLDQVLAQVAEAQIPIMGICVGMQLLFEELSEGAGQSGLGLLPGHIEPLRSLLQTGPKGIKVPKDPNAETICASAERFSVPHMGWNAVFPTNTAHSQASYALLVSESALSTACYFVHSYYLAPRSLTVATCNYGSVEISAIVRGQGQRSRIWGCQFHPEKSGAFGSQILKNWLENAN